MAAKHYVDDIPPSSGRVYLIETDGNVSKIKDVTEYQQVGSTFGASDVNRGCVLECDYIKNGTVHKLTTLNNTSENIKFFATEPFNKGDTFTFNDSVVTAQTINGQALSHNYFKANTIVECRKKGNVLYFTNNSSSILDDSTGVPYRLGIENGMMYIEEG